MITKTKILIGIILLAILLIGCNQEPQKPEGALSVAELLDDPLYDTQTRIYGEVSALGELICTCFFLQSEGENLQVWYDTMVEDSGTTMPSVNVEAIDNGDWVVIAGELKSGGIHYSLNDFWLAEFEFIQD